MTTRVALIGGGHANIEVLRRFAARPERDVAITLISPHRHTPYSGMLPGLVAGHYAFDDAHIDLEPLANRARAAFIRTAAVGIDATARIVRCADGGTVAFDIAAIDIGSTPDASVPGARVHALAVKPIDRFIERWRREIERHAAREHEGAHERQHAQERQRAPERNAGRGADAIHDDIAVVGGGAGGVELVLAMRHAATVALGRDSKLPRFHLITDTTTILPTHAPAVRRQLMRALDARDVEVHTNARAVRVEPRAVELADGRRIEADLIVWATSAAPAPWIRESGLAVDERGFMLIDRHLESVSHPKIFGAGDIASLRHARVPKSGVMAVRKGPVLAHNVRAASGGGRLLPFIPKPITLSLISTGDRCAVMSWGPFAVAGAWVWRWKDSIDRRFVAKYRV